MMTMKLLDAGGGGCDGGRLCCGCGRVETSPASAQAAAAVNVVRGRALSYVLVFLRISQPPPPLIAPATPKKAAGAFHHRGIT